MWKRAGFIVASFYLCVSAVFAQSHVVTLNEQDIAQLMATACGPQGVPGKDVHVHRNSDGSMLYMVAEGQFEGLIYAQHQMCNPLAPETLNLWRNSSDGAVIAQLAKRYDGERLLVQGSTDGIAGQHFDVSPGGQYLVISHGDSSSVSPVDRPYIRTVELQMDARRIFSWKDGLVVVGSNKAANRLEAVPVSIQAGTATAGAPIPVPGVPAGVQVLDFNNQADELLLGGLNASGEVSFAIANITTGQARLVENVKPGATTALFITDPALYARLTGAPVPAGNMGAPGAPAGEQQTPDRQRRRRSLNPFSWFGRE